MIQNAFQSIKDDFQRSLFYWLTFVLTTIFMLRKNLRKMCIRDSPHSELRNLVGMVEMWLVKSYLLLKDDKIHRVVNQYGLYILDH